MIYFYYYFKIEKKNNQQNGFHKKSRHFITVTTLTYWQYFQRSDYPLGFLVVALVLPSQESCGEEEGAQAAWLWAAALLGDEPQHKRLAAREKDFLLTVEVAMCIL